MTLQLNQVLNNTATVEVTYSDLGQCKITYRPGVITPESIAELKATDEDNATEGLIEQICKLVVTWEIEDDGAMLPITPDNCRKLPIALLGTILRGIMKEIRMGKDDEPASGEGSFSTP
jgi:hypothetical protein